MLRGSSSMATRSCKKLRMRFADCRSIFLNSLSASLASSICQTIIFHDFLKRHGLRLPLVNFLQPLFGKMQVFEIVQILLDSLNHVLGFAASSAGSQFFQPLRDCIGQVKGYSAHVDSPMRLCTKTYWHPICRLDRRLLLSSRQGCHSHCLCSTSRTYNPLAFYHIVRWRVPVSP